MSHAIPMRGTASAILAAVMNAAYDVRAVTTGVILELDLGHARIKLSTNSPAIVRSKAPQILDALRDACPMGVRADVIVNGRLLDLPHEPRHVAPCSECGGSGLIVLFTSTVACRCRA